ncbi:uncharacterized protein LOC143986801 [Lithobates pipiens]
MNIVERFGSFSGLEINCAKTELFCVDTNSLDASQAPIVSNGTIKGLHINGHQDRIAGNLEAIDVLKKVQMLKKLLNLSLLITLLMFGEDEYVKEPACSLAMVQKKPQYFSRDGDAIIGGILQISKLTTSYPPNFLSHRHPEDKCVLELGFLRHLLVFMFAIEEINNQTDLLPNITLGYQIYDVCNIESKAIQSVLDVLSGMEHPAANYDCHKKSKKVMFVGHKMTSSSVASATLTGIYGYPQINRYLRKVHIITKGGEEIKFNEGKFSPRFDLINIVFAPNKSFSLVKVGYFHNDAEEFKFKMNKKMIQWHPRFSKTLSTYKPTEFCYNICQSTDVGMSVHTHILLLMDSLSLLEGGSHTACSVIDLEHGYRTGF